jgi:hypothetical protein
MSPERNGAFTIFYVEVDGHFFPGNKICSIRVTLWQEKHRNQGCQMFLATTYQNGKNIPNDQKMNQMAIKYTKWPKNIPNGHKIYQRLPLQRPRKFTQI